MRRSDPWPPTFTVTTLDDETFEGTETTGTPDGAGLSLREALALANAAADSDDIVFDPALFGGTVFLTTLQQLTITTNLTINGDIDGDGTADIEISADSAEGANNAVSRVIALTGGVTQSVTLHGLVIRDGNSATGGGITVGDAELTLSNSTLSGNDAVSGGAIAVNAGAATLVNTTTTGNTASFIGGGLWVNTGTATLSNTTVSGNSAGSKGGGIDLTGGTLFLTNATVSGNAASQDGGGISTVTGSLTLANSIVAGNDTPNVGLTDDINAGSTVLQGGNIIGGALSVDGVDQPDPIALTDIFAFVTNNAHTGVLSGALAGNGGPVATIALNRDATNPALNAADADALNETLAGRDLNGDGDTNDTIATDARALPRSAGADIDLGAYELQAVETFDVTVSADPGTSADGTTGGVGTLSWALAQANARPGPHEINILVDVQLSGPLSPIFNSVRINGNGHTIDAQNQTRIFMVGVDLATMNDVRWAGSIIAERPQVEINDLTLANGLARGGDGNGGGGGGMGAGGALFVNQPADVTLTNVTFEDILWRNSNDGRVVVWTLTDTGFTSRTPGTLGADWQIEAVGDYNEDGRSDILWRNDATGQVLTWILDGAGSFTANTYGSPEAAWQIQNDPTTIV